MTTEERRRKRREYMRYWRSKLKEIGTSAAVQRELDEVKDLFTVAEVAELIGVAEWTIRRWLRAGTLPCIQAGKGGHYKIPAAALKNIKRGFESLRGLSC